MQATQQEPILDNKTILGYAFKNKVKINSDWFDTPFKSVVLKSLLVDKNGMMSRDVLSKLYFDFKDLTMQFNKRYIHTKMNSRKYKMLSAIDNNKLKFLYLSWLKTKGLKWGDIDKALKDLMKLYAISSIEKQGGNHE